MAVLALDASLVVTGFILLGRLRGARFAHPLTSYLFFHLLIVTCRFLYIMAGGTLLFSDTQGLVPVDRDEIEWAVFLSDLALASVLAGAYLADWRYDVRKLKTEIQPELFWLGAIVFIPIGCVAMASGAALPGRTATDLTLNSWIIVAQSSIAMYLLVFAYLYGFRIWIMTPLCGFLALMAYQGFHRFRLVIPALALSAMYLDRTGRKWPRLGLATLLLILGLLFVPLKAIGVGIQVGESVSDIAQDSVDRITSSFDNYGEFILLDEMAAAVSAADQRQLRLWGSSYLALLTLPVPRAWWPDKPGLADHLQELSSPGRPLAEMGIVATFAGDAYLNFGIFGVIVMPGLLMALLAIFCRSAYASAQGSLGRLLYILVSATLIQVWRDGILSLAVFTIVYMSPLALAVGLHYVVPRSRVRRIVPSGRLSSPPRTVRGPWRVSNSTDAS